uniref:Uncharacterized protein n=1 Tax=Anguilla anguilla TaxID=7936 RepID=A0A0E9USK5_ANGAN
MDRQKNVCVACLYWLLTRLKIKSSYIRNQLLHADQSVP